jgi:rhamnose transport system substrate-binding protein
VLRAILVTLAALLAAVVFAACGNSKDDSTSNAAPTPAPSTPAAPGTTAATPSSTAAAGGGEIQSGLKIVHMPKNLGNSYFDIADGGVKEATGEFGGSDNYTGPTEASAASQVPVLRAEIQKGFDALVFSANDPDAVAPVLKQAKDAGIAVVTYDSDANPDSRQIFINQASTEDIGKAQVEMAAEQIGGSGQIAILSASANATNQNAWIKVMKDELESNPAYANIELVDTVYGDDNDQKSFQQTQGLLQKYPDLKAIIAPTTVGIAAAARYIQGSPQKGKVAVTGLGTPNAMRDFVKDGTVKEFALWNPKDLGYLAAFAAASLKSGIITGAEGDKFTAGRLGEYTVGAEGEVLLGPPTRFNAENIDEFDF